MATPHCPFCKGTISADLAQFGGNCPHCLLEVPGEDAPTDPGAALRARQAEEEAVTARKKASSEKRRIGLGVGLIGVLLAGLGYQTWLDSQPVVFELDDYYVVPLDEMASVPVPATPDAAATTPDAATVATAAGGKKPTTGKTPRAATGSAGGAAVGAGATASASSPAGGTVGGAAVPSDVASIMAGRSSLGGSATLGGGASIDVARPDVVLTDDGAILDMAKQVINRSSPQLQACYNQRLKQVPDLAGAWKVQFVITKAGGVSGVDVNGQDRHDSDLEACIERNVAAWKFMRIAHDQTVAKTYRFKPSGG